jgi:hypothetical protein
MGLSNARLVRPAHAAAAVLLGFVSIAFVATPAQAATVDLVKEREWASGHVGKVTVRNPGPAAITSWRVEFDLPAGTSVANAWSAALTRSGSHYTFTNLRWNGTIAAGASTSFGFLARGSGDAVNCTVDGEPCAGLPPLDVTPPTTPTGAGYRVDGTSWSFSWNPSTDDTGVVGYEFFGNDGVSSTTTNTTVPLGDSPPSTGTIFGLRAVDAAGNASPAVAIAFRGDISAPTEPANLRISGPVQGYLPVTWDAARDDIVVAGYEVYLDDILVSNVGNTKAYVPYSGYGVYKVGVRAYDSMRRFSATIELSVAIDPPR